MIVGFQDQVRLGGLYWNGRRMSNRGRVAQCTVRVIGAVKYPRPPPSEYPIGGMLRARTWAIHYPARRYRRLKTRMKSEEVKR